MLTKIQVKKIKDRLDEFSNPLFLFDNDPDGLCAFLILARYLGRGKGVAIKSFPELSVDYFKRARELDCDSIVILDKPNVSQEFFEATREINMPVIWIDHHKTETKIPEYVDYFNPVYNKKESSEPTTVLCYQISGVKNDLWLMIVGAISDRFLPKEYPDFLKEYPELGIKAKDPFDVFYKSEIGKVAGILSCGLKDRISSVVLMMKFLLKARSPYDVLEESKNNYAMHKRFEDINKKKARLISRAEDYIDGKLLFFEYAGNVSMSSDLSNELHYLYPDKIVVVAYIAGVRANISARGKNVRDMLEKAIREIDGVRGGGHEMAVGAQMKLEDVDKFRKIAKEMA
ncbi:DHH family phosphoesterase [Candidatus Pacearchaeota archaeon]|nr:DHH family phosphoesterase [Candidatus Pacearchaeota archaeon]